MLFYCRNSTAGQSTRQPEAV